VDLVDRLLQSDEPSIRLQVRHGVQGAPEAEVADLREQVRRSSRVATLLSERNADGTISAHPCRAKWYGAHWVLVTMAELGYPAGDEPLMPLREQVLERKASGRCSSFPESLIPLRALHLHAEKRSDARSAAAAAVAGELFLRRGLYGRLRDGSVINPDFVQLHYPCYWHYDILFALMAFSETAQIRDERCREALDLLESKRLPDGDSLPNTVTTGTPVRWCRASGRFWIGVVSAAAISTHGYQRVPLSFSMPRAARLTFPLMLPKTDA
jgi:hypothetical protein